jgi:hypothetical protein
MIKKTLYIASFFALILVSSFVFTPAKAQAVELERILDPLCLFTCNRNNNSSYNNYNHIYESYDNNYNNYRREPTTPSYSYDNRPLEALRVTCYPMPTSIQVGGNVQWVASAYGGNGSYNYSWTGTDGLNGYGSSVTRIYNNTGTKSATVNVISGSQSISKNCDSYVNVYDNYQYYQPYNPPVYYPQQTYYQNYYPSLSVYCSANTTYVNNGSSVTWTAYPSGGNGTYTYSWSGTDGLWGSSQNIYFNYVNPGSKYASVTVYSNGQTATQSCSNTVNVANTSSNYYNPVYYAPAVTYNSNSLDIGCYSDPSSITPNQPVTWNAEVTGGVGPYTYSWTGSDNLTGSQSSVVKYYSTAGTKNAIVTVTSANGKTGVRACSNTLAVRSTSSSVAKKATTATVAKQDNTTQTKAQDNTAKGSIGGLTAASLFSLDNVPWGWVAVLIILVLFATVLYLLFNRNKI